MRIETETAVRSIVGFDSEVTKEMVERAIDILRGKTDADGGEITVHNVRFSDAMDILKVKRREPTGANRVRPDCHSKLPQ